MQIMGEFPGTENWFYVDHRNVAFIQSGRYPRHARGTDVDLPYWGDGRADWQGFDPQAYTFSADPGARRPRAVNPEATGSSSPGTTRRRSGGARARPSGATAPSTTPSCSRSAAATRCGASGGKVDLTGLTRAANLAATTDLRGRGRLPVDAPGDRQRAAARTASSLQLLDAWSRRGPRGSTPTATTSTSTRAPSR